jgi:hypothetical protein
MRMVKMDSGYHGYGLRLRNQRLAFSTLHTFYLPGNMALSRNG